MNPNKVEHKYTEKFYKYHCYRFSYSEWAPANIADKLAYMDGFYSKEYNSEQKCKRKETC